MGNSVESLTEVELDNCPFFVYQASHFITEVCHVGMTSPW